MSRNLFYVPILPSTCTAANAVATSFLYNAPEFWPLANVLREAMYHIKSQNLDCYDLPQRGEDKKSDVQVKSFIERHWGNKNVSISLFLICLLFFLGYLSVLMSARNFHMNSSTKALPTLRK